MAAQICETCKNKGCRCYCPPNSTCGAYEPREITWFEKMKSMDIEELSEWLDENGQFDNSPWMKWWDENYCNNCPSETGFITDFGGEYEWWNIHPAKFPNEHQSGIHGAGSPANELFKGGNK